MLQLRSPRGGKPLRDWFPSRFAFREPTLTPLHANERPDARLEDDFLVYHIGYCGSCATKILVRRSVADFLVRLFHRAT